MQQPTMLAKFKVNEVTLNEHNNQKVSMIPVSSNKPYGPNGENEDNTFARHTPSGEIRMQITNPDLYGQVNPGDVFYISFTKAEQK